VIKSGNYPFKYMYNLHSWLVYVFRNLVCVLFSEIARYEVIRTGFIHGITNFKTNITTCTHCVKCTYTHHVGFKQAVNIVFNIT